MGGGSSRGSPAKIVIDGPKERRPSSAMLYSPIIDLNASVSSPHLANTTLDEVAIDVKHLDSGEVTTLTVQPASDGAEDVCYQISEVAKIMVQRQKLFFEGQELKHDGRTLKEYGVVEGSTLELELREEGPLDALFADPGEIVMSKLGTTAPGQGTRRMYDGGVFGSDGCLYLVPRNAPKVACFNPADGTWKPFETHFKSAKAFPKGGYKWIGGAVSNFDDCIYCMPGKCNVVSRVLQIDPSKRTALEVGDSVLKHSEGVKDFPWYNMVAAADGCIYGIPYNATSVLKFDPRTQELSTFGKLTARAKYVSGTLGPTGRFIYCPPGTRKTVGRGKQRGKTAMTAYVLCIDTMKQTCELIGDDYGYLGWHGAALGGDGMVYCVPTCTTPINNFVLRIDPWSKTTKLFGPNLSIHDGWQCCATGADGCIYACPHNSLYVLRIDPFTDEVTTVGEAIPRVMQGKLRGILMGPDNALWCLPCNLPCCVVKLETSNPARYVPLLTKLLEPAQHKLLREGLSDPHSYGPALAAVLHWEAMRAGGDLKCVKDLLIAAAPALPACVLSQKKGAHMATLVFRAYDNVMPQTRVDVVGDSVPVEHGFQMFSGSAVAPHDDKFYLVPRNAPRAVRFDPATGAWEAFGDEFMHTNKWIGADVSTVDNCIYSVPFEGINVSQILKIDPSKSTVEMVGDSVLEYTSAISFPWHGTVAAADGCIYGIPYNATSVLKFDPRTQELSTFGDLDGGEEKYNGGILDRTGNLIFCVPAAASRVLCINTITRQCVLIGAELASRKTDKWSGGGVAGDGKIYCIPKCANRVLCIDPVRRDTKLFGPNLGNQNKAWIGGAVGIDGHVYGTPHKSSHVLRINPFSETVYTVGPAIPTELKSTLHGAMSSLDGSIWCMIKKVPSRILKITPPTFAPPLAPLREIVSNADALQRCIHIDGLREVFVPMLIHFSRYFSRSRAANQHFKRYFSKSFTRKASIHPSKSVSQKFESPEEIKCISDHMWPEIFSALRMLEAFPLPVAMKHGPEFISDVAFSEAIQRDDTWNELPETVDDWGWPPPPLVPLRAACKLVEKNGPEVVQAAWPVLSEAISDIITAIIDCVRQDFKRGTKVLTDVYDKERRRSLETYRNQMRRARRDPTYPEFKDVTERLLQRLADQNRKELRIQTISSFPKLYAASADIHPRFVAFVKEIARRCANSIPLPAPLKGCGRALEKLLLQPGVPAKVKEKDSSVLDSRTLMDVVRGSLECPDFTEIIFILELLQLLDINMGDPAKAETMGFDLYKFQICLIHIKDRFTAPTSGGWSDCLVNFKFAYDNDTQVVMELQLQHEQMLVVRKEGKAHDYYNSFRSAFEILTTLNKAPDNSFNETTEDLPKIEQLQLKVDKMQKKLTKQQKENKEMSSKVKECQSQIKSLLSTVKGLQKAIKKKK